MTYRDIKKILIRVKSRKFLTRECVICLDPITDDSMCRILSCYHIFHVQCIDSWFIKNVTCPNCKKSFNDPQNLRFDDKEFLQTINVDNEMFYSDHLVHNSHRLARTETLEKFGPFANKRHNNSFDLAIYLRNKAKLQESIAKH